MFTAFPSVNDWTFAQLSLVNCTASISTGFVLYLTKTPPYCVNAQRSTVKYFKSNVEDCGAFFSSGLEVTR